MKVESVAELKAAFDEWRSKKRHLREAVPLDLSERARRAIEMHGLSAVAEATKLERTRLRRGRKGQSRTRKAIAAEVPSFSRMDLAVPAPAPAPVAEVETPTGLRVRIFAPSEQTLGLVTSLLAMAGGAR